MIKRLSVLIIMCLCFVGYPAAASNDYLTSNEQKKVFRNFLCDSDLTQITALHAVSNGFLEGINIPLMAVQSLGSVLFGVSLNNERIVLWQQVIELEKMNPVNPLFNVRVVEFSTGKALSPILLSAAYLGKSVSNIEFLSRIKLPREYFAGWGVGLALGFANSIVDNYDMHANTINWFGMIIELIVFSCIGILTGILVTLLRRFVGEIVKYSFMLPLEIAFPKRYKIAVYKVLNFAFIVILCMSLINLAVPLFSQKSFENSIKEVFNSMNRCSFA